ncbi:unnamed protein product [Amoebophrya sp. A120]|nr:unnamed protein product [Amoebophrya sp. A120]|eukprot:GSA120T00025300001.1
MIRSSSGNRWLPKGTSGLYWWHLHCILFPILFDLEAGAGWCTASKKSVSVVEAAASMEQDRHFSSEEKVSSLAPAIERSSEQGNVASSMGYDPTDIWDHHPVKTSSTRDTCEIRFELKDWKVKQQLQWTAERANTSRGRASLVDPGPQATAEAEARSATWPGPQMETSTQHWLLSALEKRRERFHFLSGRHWLHVNPGVWIENSRHLSRETSVFDGPPRQSVVIKVEDDEDATTVSVKFQNPALIRASAAAASFLNSTLADWRSLLFQDFDAGQAGYIFLDRRRAGLASPTITSLKSLCLVSSRTAPRFLLGRTEAVVHLLVQRIISPLWELADLLLPTSSIHELISQRGWANTQLRLTTLLEGKQIDPTQEKETNSRKVEVQASQLIESGRGRRGVIDAGGHAHGATFPRSLGTIIARLLEIDWNQGDESNTSGAAIGGARVRPFGDPAFLPLGKQLSALDFVRLHFSTTEGRFLKSALPFGTSLVDGFSFSGADCDLKTTGFLEDKIPIRFGRSKQQYVFAVTCDKILRAKEVEHDGEESGLRTLGGTAPSEDSSAGVSRVVFLFDAWVPLLRKGRLQLVGLDIYNHKDAAAARLLAAASDQPCIHPTNKGKVGAGSPTERIRLKSFVWDAAWPSTTSNLITAEEQASSPALPPRPLLASPPAAPASCLENKASTVAAFGAPPPHGPPCGLTAVGQQAAERDIKTGMTTRSSDIFTGNEAASSAVGGCPRSRRGEEAQGAAHHSKEINSRADQEAAAAATTSTAAACPRPVNLPASSPAVAAGDSAATPARRSGSTASSAAYNGGGSGSQVACAGLRPPVPGGENGGGGFVPPCVPHVLSVQQRRWLTGHLNVAAAGGLQYGLEPDGPVQQQQQPPREPHGPGPDGPVQQQQPQPPQGGQMDEIAQRPNGVGHGPPRLNKTLPGPGALASVGRPANGTPITTHGTPISGVVLRDPPGAGGPASVATVSAPPSRPARPQVCEEFDTVWDLIRRSPAALEHASEACRDSFYLVLEAVRFEEVPMLSGGTEQHDDPSDQKPPLVFGLLRFASTRLQDHGEIVFPAVKRVAHNLKFASARLRDDKNLVVIAVTGGVGAMLEFASARLRGDRDVVRLAIDNEVDTTNTAPPQEGGIADTSSDCVALKFASSDLQADRELGLVAVKRCGRALRFLDFALRDDDEVCREAIAQDRTALDFTSERFRDSHNQAEQRATTLAWVVTGVAIGLATLALLVAVFILVRWCATRSAAAERSQEKGVVAAGPGKVRFDMRQRRFVRTKVLKPNEVCSPAAAPPSEPVVARKGRRDHRNPDQAVVLLPSKDNDQAGGEQRQRQPSSAPTTSQQPPAANDKGGGRAGGNASSAAVDAEDEEAPAGKIKEPFVFDHAPQTSAGRTNNSDVVESSPDDVVVLEGGKNASSSPDDVVVLEGGKNASVAPGVIVENAQEVVGDRLLDETDVVGCVDERPGEQQEVAQKVKLRPAPDTFPPTSAARLFPATGARKQHYKPPCSKAGPPPPVQNFRTVKGRPARVRVYEARDEDESDDDDGEGNNKKTRRPAQGRCFVIKMEQRDHPVVRKKVKRKEQKAKHAAGGTPDLQGRVQQLHLQRQHEIVGTAAPIHAEPLQGHAAQNCQYYQQKNNAGGQALISSQQHPLHSLQEPVFASGGSRGGTAAVPTTRLGKQNGYEAAALGLHRYDIRYEQGQLRCVQGRGAPRPTTGQQALSVVLEEDSNSAESKANATLCPEQVALDREFENLCRAQALPWQQGGLEFELDHKQEEDVYANATAPELSGGSSGGVLLFGEEFEDGLQERPPEGHSSSALFPGPPHPSLCSEFQRKKDSGDKSCMENKDCSAPPEQHCIRQDHHANFDGLDAKMNIQTASGINGRSGVTNFKANPVVPQVDVHDGMKIISPSAPPEGKMNKDLLLLGSSGKIFTRPPPHSPPPPLAAHDYSTSSFAPPETVEEWEKLQMLRGYQEY